MDIHYVDVFRDGLGPFDGVVIDNVLAYTLVWTERRLGLPVDLHERVFVLLDLGIQLSCPEFIEVQDPSRAPLPSQIGPDRCSWYVDLVAISSQDDRITIRDLYIDVTIATDGRGYRLLDLEEFGQALETGQITAAESIDGMKRWQAFLDRHLHAGPYPVSLFPDFPPAALNPLITLESLKVPTA